MLSFSAPGDSPPPLLRNTHGAIPNIRRDVSEVRRDVADTQTMVSSIHAMLRSQQGIGDRCQLVSVARNLPLAGYTLTVT